MYSLGWASAGTVVPYRFVTAHENVKKNKARFLSDYGNL